MRALLLGLLLAGAPALASAQYDHWDDEGDDAGERDRLFVIAWGGEGFDTSGSGGSGPRLGGEVGWAFDAVDVSVAGHAYRDLPDAARAWTPVALLRLTERFRTGTGLEAAVSFGAGAARLDSWVAWFQVALGVRLDLGPMFLGGELAFEQYDQLRLMGGLGARF